MGARAQKHLGFGTFIIARRWQRKTMVSLHDGPARDDHVTLVVICTTGLPDGLRLCKQVHRVLFRGLRYAHTPCHKLESPPPPLRTATSSGQRKTTLSPCSSTLPSWSYRHSLSGVVAHLRVDVIHHRRIQNLHPHAF